MAKYRFSKRTLYHCTVYVLCMLILAYLTTKLGHRAAQRLQTGHVFTKYNWNALYNFINYLALPSPYYFPQNTDKRYSQANQDEKVFELFPKQNGFFIEIGAFDGITFSNTLWLERKHNWTGILIEANPDLCKAIDSLQRRSWRLCACISEKPNKTFIKEGASGSAAETVDDDHFKLLNEKFKITVPCFRLYHILNTLQRRHIDYFSLDVEGDEISILNSIKRELKSKMITVDMWTIGYKVVNAIQKNIVHKSIHNLKMIRNYFREVGGYFEHSQLSNIPFLSDGYGLDVIFINVESWCKNHTYVPSGAEC